MPIIKSAIKRMRQETVRRERNNTFRATLRTEIKALRSAAQGGDTKVVAEKLRSAQSQLSKAVKKNLLHRNTAARKLAALHSIAKQAGASPTTATKAKKPAGKSAAQEATAASTKQPTKQRVSKKSSAKTT